MRARARHSDPATSHAAAGGVNVSANQRAVVTVLAVSTVPLLDEEIIKCYRRWQVAMRLPRQSDQSIRSRRAELARMDPPLIVEVGIARMSTGRMGRTWALPRDQDSDTDS